MSYKVILQSEIGTIGDDIAQLVFEFINSGTGPDLVYDSDDTQIVIESLGDIEWRYELEDLLLVPSLWRLRISDFNSFFRDIITDDSFDKYATVKLLINSSDDFVGKIQEGSIDYDKGKLTCNLTVDCNTTLINKQMLYNLDDTPINPLGYLIGEWPLITDVIKDCYKLINTNIAVEIFQDWDYKGQESVDPFDEDEFIFDELHLFTDPIFLTNEANVNNIGDVLRTLAADTGCFTGALDLNNAFFKKLFHYDSNNTQNIGTPLKHRITYPYTAFDYIVVKIGSSVGHEEGTFTQLEGKYLERTPFLTESINSTLLRGESDKLYFIFEARDNNVEASYSAYQNVLTKFWYKYRSNPLRLDKFLLDGVKYNFLKSFPFENGKYQIIRMKKLFSLDRTEIDAIYLGELS